MAEMTVCVLMTDHPVVRALARGYNEVERENTSFNIYSIIVRT
jgi:hypothetical protein